MLPESVEERDGLVVIPFLQCDVVDHLGQVQVHCLDLLFVSVENTVDLNFMESQASFR